MRDAYEVLGVSPGASFEEVRAAYRRASKQRHPDMGGSHEAMVELNTAYGFILHELKRGYRRQEEAGPTGGHAAAEDEARARREWQRAYRDIDDELEELRREAQAREEALRVMRAKAWERGDRATWAKLTWEDLKRFILGVARSGLKGAALIVAALMGVGSVLMEANAVSALILLGSGIGFVVSLALKSDKGGLMSAGLLLFGLMTLWIAPVRAVVVAYPFATLNVLVCLALIFKFGQMGGRAGLMTGGVIALITIAVIVVQTMSKDMQEAVVKAIDPAPPPSTAPQPPSLSPSAPVASGYAAPTASRPTTVAPVPAPPVAGSSRPVGSPNAVPEMDMSEEGLLPYDPVVRAEPRTLIATPGAVLRFAAGVAYRVKVRSGVTTAFRATSGTIALFSSGRQLIQCQPEFGITKDPAPLPFQEIEIRACGPDAMVRVSEVR